MREVLRDVEPDLFVHLMRLTVKDAFFFGCRICCHISHVASSE